MNVSVEQARLIKPKARATVEACGAVVGVGLTKIGDSYAVKVNMREQVRTPNALPDSIDGVRIVYEVVGPVSPQTGTR
jgi:hypothetical protein